jgi:hypothetical protein
MGSADTAITTRFSLVTALVATGRGNAPTLI